MNPHDHDLPHLPEPLVNDLRTAYLGSGTQDISPSVDRHVLAAFRPHRRYRWAPWSAAAALALLVGGVTWYQLDHQAPTPAAALAYAPTGDIRDAFYLARQLADHHAASPQAWDKTRDGLVNQDDVRALAFAAVALPGERP